MLPTLAGNGDVVNLAPGAAPLPSEALRLHAMEVLFEIQSRQFLVPMNTTLDYSYFDAPRSALHAIIIIQDDHHFGLGPSYVYADSTWVQ